MTAMAKHEIIFEISKSGEIRATVKGLKGRGCEQVIENLEDLGSVTAREKTSEYFNAGNVSTRTSARMRK